MLRFEILNKREVACREVKEDCMNIQDSRLFIKGGKHSFSQCIPI